MKMIGIGGAGSKIATKLDSHATLINVSETEMNKVPGHEGQKIVATVRSVNGQFQGSRKNPMIGEDAYKSICRQLKELSRGSMVFSSTGGGTGNGIMTGFLNDLAQNDQTIPEEAKTFFGLILPYAPMESSEFVNNTINFLTGPVSQAIDSGNTGNIVLFSNKIKYQKKISEQNYNQMLTESLNEFLSIPIKNDQLTLLDEHIDHEDFASFIAKPYFNHFTTFTYNPTTPFGDQLNANPNPLLLPPEQPIEAMFLLEVPDASQATLFYDILAYFNSIKVSPVYSVLENPALATPKVTVALLYSRKPAELVEDFNKISEEHLQNKVQRTYEQHVVLPTLNVKVEDELRQIVHNSTNFGESAQNNEDDILATLRRLKKI